MRKQVVPIPGAASSDTAFNHVVSAGGFLFLTSQLSADLGTGKIIPGTITQQTTKAMENVKELLALCGAGMDDVVRAVIYLRRAEHRPEVNEVYRRYFTKGMEPAKVTVVAPSPIEAIDVEIEVTAIAPEPDKMSTGN